MATHGRQEPPLAKGLLEKVFVTIETDQEPVRRSVGEDQPDAVPEDDRGEAANPDDAPAALGDQLATDWPHRTAFSFGISGLLDEAGGDAGATPAAPGLFTRSRVGSSTKVA